MENKEKGKPPKKKWTHAEKRSKYFKDVIAQQPENKNWMQNRVKSQSRANPKSNTSNGKSGPPFVNKREKYIVMQYKKKFKDPHSKETIKNDNAETAFNQNKQKRYRKSKYELSQEEKRGKDAERNQAEAERLRKVEKRKQDRAEKMKILNQKTSKGQPLMKGRIQLLLKKIQNS